MNFPIVIAMAFCCGTDGSFGDDAEFEVLREVIEDSRREVSFHATFRVRSGVVASIDTALQGQIEVPPPEQATAAQFEATGTLNKKKQWVYCSLQYAGGIVKGPSASVTNESDPRRIANVSFVEASDDRIQVRYIPKEPGHGDSVTFSTRDQTLMGSFTPGPNTEGLISPIAPTGNYKFALLDLKTGNPAIPIQRTVRSIDAEHVEAVMSALLPGVWEQERRVIVWTKPSPPVVEKITHTAVSINGEVRRQSGFVAVSSDFVLCGALLVPRRVVFVSEGPHGITAKEWASADLGDREPTDSDFDVEIAPTTQLSGLKIRLDLGDAPRIRLSEIDLSNLGDGVFAPRAVSAPQRHAPNPAARTPYALVLTCGVILGCGLAFTLFWWRWTRATRPGGREQ